ncbi:ribosome small subunit-dependent GTPase A [Paenibacillus sp.]|uniref:ribosome small subunit-dependent GTPase A n=1 Tax=Paenibacillus sp. TaxID=58172 RepID=UPI002D4B4D8D|nr:ribosome small subunit-dependent GTPase A [Paenibacillus sp.]HZG84471.1 ribosome small subunit-dependent GTPase A [Paenibacillus sp.]
MQDGLIVKALSGFYYVQPEGGGDVVACRARGLFKKQGVSPLVGDRVRFEAKDDGSGEGTVIELMPRSTELVRPPIANCDTALIVFAVARPELNRTLLDKFLVLAELAGLESILCLTKADLLDGAGEDAAALRGRIEELRKTYEAIGYRVFFTSARAGTGADELRVALQGRIAVVAGQSGVGKSSLLNRLAPGLSLETNEISEKLGRGKHTTRHVELFRVGESGLLADTPGFSSLEFPEEIGPEDVAAAFPEFVRLAEGCKFRGCLHLKEPGCRVRQAVENGEADAERYDHYAAFATEVRERKRRY